MNTKHFRLTAMLIILLSACAQSDPDPLSALDPSQYAHPEEITAAQADSTGLVGRPHFDSQSPTSPEAITLEAGVPVARWDEQTQSHLLYLVNPLTGETIPGAEPVKLGHNYYYAVAPGGNTLAMVSLSDVNTGTARLHLIALAEWTEITMELDLGRNDWIPAMAFSPDGRLLAFSSGPPQSRLFVIEVDGMTLRTHPGTGSYISRLAFTRDSQAVMTYELTTQENLGAAIGYPRVSLLSVADFSLQWSAVLEGVLDGMYPKDKQINDEGQMHQPGAAWRFTPGLAFSVQEDVLYLVHPDSDRLTSVDFSRRKVRTVDIEPALTWFERLLSLTAGVAHAKVMDGTAKQVAISPDGSRLYIVGLTTELRQQSDGEWELYQSALDFQIVRAEDGRLLAQQATQAEGLSLAPEGTFLYLHQWQRSGPVITPRTEIFDLESQAIVATLDGLHLQGTRRLDGRPVLVSAWQAGSNTTSMAVVDPAGWTAAGEWDASGYTVWILLP